MSLNSELDIPHALIARYTHIGATCQTDPVFSGRHDVTVADYCAALASGLGDDEAVTLYVHLPFCPVRCLNCNQNTTVTHDPADIDRYLDALAHEAELIGATQGARRRLQQLHIGGGSPNYLSDGQLVRLMSIIDRHFVVDEQTKTSLEANPKRTSPAQLALLSGLGFREITFSIADLDPNVQLAIGKVNSIEVIRDVFDSARALGFDSIATNLTYGLPCQSVASMEGTVRDLLDLAPDRISCFPFARHAAERSHHRAIASCTVPSLADKLALFHSVVQGLSSDYAWIGLDSFARHGDALEIAQNEHRLRKNWIGYTDLPPASVIGFGTNAISDVNGICVQNHLEIAPWKEAVDAGVVPIRGGVRLSDQDRRRREAIIELTCNMALNDYASLFEDAEEPSGSWSSYARDGLLSIDDAGVSITPQGRFMLQQLWNDAGHPTLATA